MGGGIRRQQCHTAPRATTKALAQSPGTPSGYQEIKGPARATGWVTVLHPKPCSASFWREGPCPAAEGSKLTKCTEKQKPKMGIMVEKNQDPERFGVLCT